MLSPGFNFEQSPRKLLPEEEQLLELLGWSEEELYYFNSQKANFSDIRLGDPVNFDPITITILLVVGIALNYAAAALTPVNKPGTPARLEQRTTDGQSIIQSSRFAPTSGFDSQQNVVELGSIVPVIFAKRETISGITYGGIRVNTNLLWSQLYSLGGSQLFKGLYLIGHADINSIDPRQFAIGDNLLSSYDLTTAGNVSGRLSFYFSGNGGRIRSTDLIAGRAAANDVANSENAGAADVFQIRSVNGAFLPDFCQTGKPSTQTTFGLYAPIGNDLAFRVNPVIRSISVAQLSAVGDNGDAIVRCNDDAQLKVERAKQNVHFSTRSGIIGVNGSPTSDGTVYSVNLNDTITYLLSSIADNDTVFQERDTSGPDGEATCEDVAQAVSGLQRSWDDALIIGEMYRIGSCVAILESRSPGDEVFVSRVDNDPVGGGRDVTCVFRVTAPGQFRATDFDQISEDGGENTEHRNGTNGSHIFRVAVATASLDRPAQVVEIGFRSTSSIRISGLCNFPSCKTYQEADRDSCERYEGDRIRKGSTLTVNQFQSGTYTGPETRYSFFRFGFRIAGSDAAFTLAPQLFGFRSMTGQASFNYLRIQFPSAQRWEWELMPVSGWEIRDNIATGDLEVLDAKVQSIRVVYGAGCAFEFNGLQVERSRNTFGIKSTETSKDIGLDDKDNRSYADSWGKLAEQFIFQEIQASTDSPEHEISYVNAICRNVETPLYDQLAALGATVRSSNELRDLQQLSVYVNSGVGNTHLIGDVLYRIATNGSYGLGQILSTQQLDGPSFTAADIWTYNRRYFFDGALSEAFNFRQQGAEWAEYFLHDLLIRGGRFYLQPIANFGTPHDIGAMYTAGNVSEFEYVKVDPDQRTPPRVSVKWREEKQSSDLAGRGLFPVVREVTVREVGTPDDAPLELIDLTSGLNNFCTSEVHAIDVAKMRCRKKRLITSRVRLTTRPDRAAFDPGKIIKIGMETVSFDLPQNGAILADGTVVAIPDETGPTTLPDGNYNALVWTGTGTNVQEVSLVVTGGRNLTYANSVYSLANVALSSQTYKIQKADFNADGDVEVEATEFPLDENRLSLLTQGWDVVENWVIEGRIGSFVPDITVNPAFSSVSIFGSSTAPQGVASGYTSTIAGPAGSYTYSWSATGSPTSSSLTSPATNFTWATAGTYTITLSVNGPGPATRTDTLVVTVGAVVVLPTIGTVTVSGTALVLTGATVTYTASNSGSAGDIIWEWTVSGPGGDIIPLDIDNSTPVTFGAPGNYNIRAKAVSATASDSPQADDLSVVVWDGYTVLLLHMNGFNTSTTFVDSSRFNRTSTPADNAQISSAQSKFDGASALFDSTGDYLDYAGSSDFAFLGDFTVDMWFCANDFNVYSALIQTNTFPDGLIIRIDGTDDLYVNSVAIGNIRTFLTISTWHHVAMTRSGTTVRVFVDGTVRRTATVSGTVNSVNGGLRIGSAIDAGFQDAGVYIDEVRIMKGFAAWTADFTPPAAPYLPA